jgi:hypothetical protein
MELTVYAVLVPPFQCGVAYGHTTGGECVRFSGDRDEMIALCNEVKAHTQGMRAPVQVHTARWREVAVVQQHDCPAHWPSVA